MKPLVRPVRHARPVLVLLGLMLFPGIACAQTPYAMQPIVKLGDKVEDLTIKPDGHFEIGTLNDNGQLVFTVESQGGGPALIRYAAGRLTAIVTPGRDAPGGKWSQDSYLISSPVSMNQLGNVVFAAAVSAGGRFEGGTFLWDSKAQKVTLIARRGTPVGVNRKLLDGSGPSPVINNRGEIALVGKVNSAGDEPSWGIFIRDGQGRWWPVAIPGQALPGGERIRFAFQPTLNDAGAVGFQALRSPGMQGAYVWPGTRGAGSDEITTLVRPEPNRLTVLALTEVNLPGVLFAIGSVWVNDRRRSVLVHGIVGGVHGDQDRLYRFANGKLTPVVQPGQEMPGGGRLQSLQTVPGYIGRNTISFANEAGQHAFLARLEDGSTAAYLLDADDKLSLILKRGMTTGVGKVTHIGGQSTPQGPKGSFGIGLNSKGQIALPVQIDGGVDTVVLLTPTAR